MFSRKILRIKAMQYLFAFFVQEKSFITLQDSSVQSAKNTKEYLNRLKNGLRQEAFHIKHICFELLQLLATWTSIDLEQKKKAGTAPSGGLYKNYVLQRIQKHIKTTTFTSPYTWSEELAETWFQQCLKDHPLFVSYTSQNLHSPEEDQAFVISMIKKIILKDKNIQQHIAWEDMGWRENKLIVQQLILKFIEALAIAKTVSSQAYDVKLTIAQESFYTHLVDTTVQHTTSYEKYITQKLKNWELTRLSLLDDIFLKMALTETTYKENIPKAIIINEYVNLAKKYSTPKSYSFINGILEVLIDEKKVDGQEHS